MGMIRVFYIRDNELVWEKQPDDVVLDSNRIYTWIDLLNPTPEQRQKVEAFFDVTLQTNQEAAEIESSSRYREDGSSIKANSGFLTKHEHPEIQQVSFLLKGLVLFTIRNVELNSFGETVRKIKVSHHDFIKTGAQIWMLLLETCIDADADYIEDQTRITNRISHDIQHQNDLEGTTLRKIAELQETTILIRESIIDKQRLISALLKSPFIPEEISGRLRVIMKDVISLLQHTQFSFERLEYLQNTFLGLVNIEQNKIIKIFTVASVIFMPPTLIASIYGMNFRSMPELSWHFGYPLAIVIMVTSSAVTLFYFRRKKWL